MQTTDFSVEITVEASMHEVFEAVTTPQNWWTGHFEGDTKNLNDEFTYRYEDMHYSKQRVIELHPNQKVVWLVTDSRLNFLDDKEEWTGTKMIFDISATNDKTKLIFTHVGINPQVECYYACSAAWGQLISQNLRNYITTGKIEKPEL